jgi:cysteine desulfurase NifS
MIVLGGSIITAWPRPEIWRETLGALDFLVCIDRQMTADCAYADLVLPATTMYEIDSYMRYGPIFRLREKVVEPVGEARNDFLILAELARRLGYGHLYPRSEEELQRQALAGSGFTLEQVREAGGTVRVPGVMVEYKKWEKGLLRPDGQPGFDTPTGKLEIASTILEEHGYDPLPVYTEPGEGPLSRPDLMDRYPLVFNSGARVSTDFRSQHHGVPGLRERRPEPTVTIHTEDALERGIADGDRVVLRSPRGQVELRAFVTEDIVRGAVDANMGGGGPVGPEAWQDCNINELTDLERFDPISGFPVCKTLLCDVARADGAGERLTLGSGEESGVHAGAASRPARETERRRVYLDFNATTPVAPEVRAAMSEFLGAEAGNPTSLYDEGRRARAGVEAARRQLAQLLNCTARRIVFTGGGSEANNLAIKGAVFARPERRHLVTSAIEHPAVLATCRWLAERMGFRVTELPVDRFGRVEPATLGRALDDDTVLVSIMTANNETGSVQPIRELAAQARERGALFHTDAVQAAGRLPLDVDDLGVDLLSLSGHKLLGPKGVGALYVRKGLDLDPLIHGGGQEHGLRAGTENVPGIVGMGKAAELAARRLPRLAEMRSLRDRLQDGLMEIFPDARLNGHPTERLPNTINLTIPGVRGEALVLAMDRFGVAFSSGSACRAGSPNPSHALIAMGLSEEDAHCAVRLSVGAPTAEEDIDYVLGSFRQVAEGAAEVIKFATCR